MLEEIRNISTSKKDIKKFSYLVGGILILISLVLLWKDSESFEIILGIGAALILIGLIVPIILKPLYLAWMVFAIILGWVMTRVILTIVFYIVVVPIGLIAKLFRRKFLDLSFKTDSDTYWNYRKDSINDIEKQF